jgi:hypothetical protein
MMDRWAVVTCEGVREVSRPPLDVVAYRMLLADWFRRLARDAGWDLGQYGRSGHSYTFGRPAEGGVTASFTDFHPFLTFETTDEEKHDLLKELVGSAVRRADAVNFGGIVWYSTTLEEIPFTLSPSSFMGTFLERLGGQVRVHGWRRLGRDVLVKFTEAEPEETSESNQLFAPKAGVEVHIASPGPIDGHFSSRVAHGAIELVGAICTFALGRPVRLPHLMFPSETEHLENLNARRADRTVRTLARRGVGLNIFAFSGMPGGMELFARTRAAMLTYDAALRQEHDSVAALLYLVALESLATPNTPWKTERVTARFREFVEQLLEPQLDAIVAKESFERTFGIRRGARSSRALRRALLERLYAYRSGWVHEGLDPNYHPMGVGFEGEVANRRSAIRDLAEGAIVEFIGRPRSSLIGAPDMSREEA